MQTYRWMSVGATSSVAMVDEERGRKCCWWRWCCSLLWSWASLTRRLLCARCIGSHRCPKLTTGKPLKSQEKIQNFKFVLIHPSLNTEPPYTKHSTSCPFFYQIKSFLCHWKCPVKSYKCSLSFRSKGNTFVKVQPPLNY